MRKAFLTLISIALILSLAIPAMPVFAAVPAGTVGKFTPQIDAEKDEAYNQSFTFNIFDQDNATKGEGWWTTYDSQTTVADANIWFLWDNSFLYAFVDVLIPEVVNRGEDFIKTENNPWEANSVELWVLWADLDSAEERVKTSVDPLYNRSWGDGPYFEDIEPNTKKVAKLTSKGYAAEFAIPIPAANLKEGGKVKFTLQVNHYDGKGTIPVGQQIGGGQHDVDLAPLLTFGAPIVIAAPEPEPAPVVEEAAAPVIVAEVAPAPAPVAVAPTAVPPTGDTALILLAIALIGAGVITRRIIKI